MAWQVCRVTGDLQAFIENRPTFIEDLEGGPGLGGFDESAMGAAMAFGGYRGAVGDSGWPILPVCVSWCSIAFRSRPADESSG